MVVIVVNVLNATELYLKNGSDGKFYVACVLPQFLKKVSPHKSKEEKNNTR